MFHVHARQIVGAHKPHILSIRESRQEEVLRQIAPVEVSEVHIFAEQRNAGLHHVQSAALGADIESVGPVLRHKHDGRATQAAISSTLTLVQSEAQRGWIGGSKLRGEQSKRCAHQQLVTMADIYHSHPQVLASHVVMRKDNGLAPPTLSRRGNTEQSMVQRCHPQPAPSVFLQRVNMMGCLPTTYCKRHSADGVAAVGTGRQMQQSTGFAS